jgi:TnpA family transposase
MPGRVFTEQERKRLDAFPAEIAESDLIRYFTLSGSDLEFVRRQRGDYNRLGFAFQLCALRYLGFAPDDLTTPPATAITFLADQLEVSPAVLHSYGARSQTRTDHLQQIQLYLGFRDATREDLRALADWLLARALEHDKPSLLFQLACEHLRTEKVVRPGVTRIERLVMAVRERGYRETFRRLASFFTENG